MWSCAWRIDNTTGLRGFDGMEISTLSSCFMNFLGLAFVVVENGQRAPASSFAFAMVGDDGQTLHIHLGGDDGQTRYIL
jgi:hypothetical protein